MNLDVLVKLNEKLHISARLDHMKRIKMNSEEKQNEQLVEWIHQELPTFTAHALRVTQ